MCLLKKNPFQHKEVTQDSFPNSRTHSYAVAWGVSQLQIHHEYGKKKSNAVDEAHTGENQPERWKRENRKNIYICTQKSPSIPSF